MTTISLALVLAFGSARSGLAPSVRAAQATRGWSKTSAALHPRAKLKKLRDLSFPPRLRNSWVTSCRPGAVFPRIPGLLARKLTADFQNRDSGAASWSNGRLGRTTTGQSWGRAYCGTFRRNALFYRGQNREEGRRAGAWGRETGAAGSRPQPLAAQESAKRPTNSGEDPFPWVLTGIRG
jgi:hypothetical protein